MGGSIFSTPTDIQGVKKIAFGREGPVKILQYQSYPNPSICLFDSASVKYKKNKSK